MARWRYVQALRIHGVGSAAPTSGRIWWLSRASSRLPTHSTHGNAQQSEAGVAKRTAVAKSAATSIGSRTKARHERRLSQNAES
eukprot:COSAG06_NODE_43_length_29826_cov_32.009621_7_plen_84_part_00